MPAVELTEELAQAGTARITVAAEPVVPARARLVRGGEKRFLAEQVGGLERGGGDGHHHLDLGGSELLAPDVAREIPVGTLMVEEDVVIRACDRRIEPAVDQPLERTALEPYPGIASTLDQNRMVVRVDVRDVARQAGQCLIVPCANRFDIHS